MRTVWRAAFAVLALVASARAQPVEIRLEDALALAETQNPELVAARARAEAQRFRAEAASRVTWPRLVASTDWSVTDNPARVFAAKLNRGAFTAEDFAIDRLNDPDALAHLTTAIGVEWPVDVFGGARARARAAEAAGRTADAEAGEAGQEVRLGVVASYLRAVLARRAVAVTARAVDSARAREADVEARVEEGSALRADLLRARARRRQREAEHAAAEADAALGTAGLARVLGAPAGTTYAPAADEAPAAGSERALEEWTARAVERRPRRRALDERTAAAGWALRAEERTVLPDLSVFGQWIDDRGGSDSRQSTAFGVSLRWTAFDRARSRRKAAAEAERQAVEAEARAVEHQIRLEVETAWRRAQAAAERHRAAAGGAEEGREALRVVQERRQEGMATLTDELETESASVAAELEELRAGVEAALVHAQLRRAAGEL